MNLKANLKLESANIVRETEKALLINVAFGDEFKADVWFPKSQTDVRDDGIYASAWILEQKDQECRDLCMARAGYFPCPIATAA